MYTAQQIFVLEESLSMAKEKLRTEAEEGLMKNERYHVCVHIREGRYAASIWEKERSYKDKDSASFVTEDGIENGKNVSQEQNKYCEEIQQYLCSIKN